MKCAILAFAFGFFLAWGARAAEVPVPDFIGDDGMAGYNVDEIFANLPDDIFDGVADAQ